MRAYEILIESDEYKGEHTAPGKGDAPIFNLDGTYPDDIYSVNGARYYGDGANEASDRQCISILSVVRNKPNAAVKIYRSVPDLNKDATKEIKALKDLIAYYHRFNFFPMQNKIIDDIESNYAEMSYNDKQQHILQDLNTKLNELTNSLTKITINPGDWVTTVRQYAIDHGEAHLGGKFKVLTKTVKAKDVYTDGNSIYEYGYDPE